MDIEAQNELIVYITYTPAQRRANKKYYDANKETILLQHKLNYIKKSRDEDYLEKKRQKGREYYYRKKQEKEQQSQTITA